MVSPRASKSLIVLSKITEIGKNGNNVNNKNDNELEVKYQHPYDLLVPPKNEVFIGNLKHDILTRTLIDNLQVLFATVGVTIPDFRITLCILRKGNKPRKYAYVLFINKYEENQLYKLDGTKDLHFIIDGLELRVTERRSTRNQKLSRFNKVTFDGRKCLLNRSKSDPAVSMSFHNNEIRTTVYQKVLYYGQHLQTEDRVTEYKRGSGNYMKHMLIPHIRKYICAFLNSEGGRLMIGVNDECKVYGISCTRKQEDLARCQIDNTIKHFQPHVMPNMYMIDFIPVKLLPNDNIEFDFIDPLLKVLKVSVNKQNVVNSLYETDKEQIYVRRDGSVEGPLKTSQIVEWCRVNFSNSNNHHSNNKENIDINTSNNNTIPFCQRCHVSKVTKGTEDVLSTTLDTKLNQIKENQDKLLEHLQESLMLSQQKMKEEFQKLQEKIERKEEILKKELEKTKLSLQRKDKSLERRKTKNTYSFLCNII